MGKSFGRASEDVLGVEEFPYETRYTPQITPITATADNVALNHQSHVVSDSTGSDEVSKEIA